jgi:hypothetical protein
MMETALRLRFPLITSSGRQPKKKIVGFIRCIQDIRIRIANLLLVTNRLFQEKVYKELRRIFGDSERVTA